MNMFVFGTVLCLSAFLGLIDGSAIPMWEFLSKDEKMSYLMYSCFTTQVEKYCKNSELQNCNKELLKYGLNNLRNLTKEELDSLDPYQRGANQLIWETLLKGHRLMKAVPKPDVSSSTAKPNSYDDESFGEDFAEQGLASARIDNIYVVAPPKEFLMKWQSGSSEYAAPPVGALANNVNTPRKGGAFRRFQQQYHPVAVTTEKVEEEIRRDVPLTGPVEYKVYYPDGTPVREGSTAVPYDEDLRQYRLSKRRLPIL